jgi:hypothetical protein
MSARSDLQDRLEGFLNDNGLNEVYGVLGGGEATKLANGKMVRTLSFCKARTLDGEVMIWGPRYIVVTSNRTGTDIFDSVEAVEAFLMARFVDWDEAAANAIPRRGE